MKIDGSAQNARIQPFDDLWHFVLQEDNKATIAKTMLNNKACRGNFMRT